jgi:hypothetical protein
LRNGQIAEIPGLGPAHLDVRCTVVVHVFERDESGNSGSESRDSLDEEDLPVLGLFGHFDDRFRIHDEFCAA